MRLVKLVQSPDHKNLEKNLLRVSSPNPKEKSQVNHIAEWLRFLKNFKKKIVKMINSKKKKKKNSKNVLIIFSGFVLLFEFFSLAI